VFSTMLRRAGLLCALVLALAASPARAAEPPPPPGANDFSCKPTAAHPEPVVLVHGTFANRFIDWAALSPRLKTDGYCVFALNYGGSDGGPALGIYATGPIANSAQELKSFVQQVRSATHAPKVALVGHSQGGMMPRWYIKFLGGGGAVDDLVGLVPSNHGTTNPLAPPAGQLGCPACAEQAAGSTFLQTLNAGDETPEGPTWVSVWTTQDETVTPPDSARLEGAVNLTVQSVCADATVGHGDLPSNRLVQQIVVTELAAGDPVQLGPGDCARLAG